MYVSNRSRWSAFVPLGSQVGEEGGGAMTTTTTLPCSHYQSKFNYVIRGLGTCKVDRIDLDKEQRAVKSARSLTHRPHNKKYCRDRWGCCFVWACVYLSTALASSSLLATRHLFGLPVHCWCTCEWVRHLETEHKSVNRQVFSQSESCQFDKRPHTRTCIHSVYFLSMLVCALYAN